MKKFTIIALSILVGVLVIWFYRPSSKRDYVVKKEKNVLCFGTCADYPPMEYYQDETITGFEIELTKLIGQKLKKGIVFEDMAFGPLQVALEKGLIDAFVAAFGVTPEGRKKFDFTIPYYIERMVFLHKKSDPITNLKELSRKKIIYQLSGPAKESLEANIPEAELVSVDRIDVAMEMFKAGHGDCVYMDVFVADGYCEENPQWTYLVLDALKVSDGIAIVLPKGSPLRAEINKILKELEASGALQALREKWKLETAWQLPNE
jgi:polar amino acid transport system substrate-binding protein